MNYYRNNYYYQNTETSNSRVKRYDIEPTFPKVQEKVNKLKLDWLDIGTIYHSPKVVFYTKDDIQELSGWSKEEVRLLFFDRRFPSCNFGRKEVVEVHALIDFFIRKERMLRLEQMLQELRE